VDEALTIAIRLGHFEIADFLIEEHGARYELAYLNY